MFNNKKNLLFIIIAALIVVIIIFFFYKNYKIKVAQLYNLQAQVASFNEELNRSPISPLQKPKPNQPPYLFLYTYPENQVTLGDNLYISTYVYDPECKLTHITINSRNLKSTGSVHCFGSLSVNGKTVFYGNDVITANAKDINGKSTTQRKTISVVKGGYGYGIPFPNDKQSASPGILTPPVPPSLNEWIKSLPPPQY